MNEKQYCRLMSHNTIETSMMCLNPKCSNSLCWICAQCLIEQDHSQQKDLHFCESIGFDIQKNKIIQQIKNAIPKSSIKEGLEYFQKIGQHIRNIIKFYTDCLDVFHKVVEDRCGKLQDQVERVQKMRYKFMSNQDIEFLGRIDTMIDAESENKIIQEQIKSFRSKFNSTILQYVATNIENDNQSKLEIGQLQSYTQKERTSKLQIFKSFISRNKQLVPNKMSQSVVLERDQVQNEFQCLKNFEKLQQSIPYCHKKHINSISISTDNQYLVSGGQDQYLKIWNIQQDKLILQKECSSSVDAVAISNDNKQIAVALQHLLIFQFDQEKLTLKEFIEIQPQIVKVFYIDITKLVVIGIGETKIISFQNNQTVNVKIDVDNIVDADYSHSHRLFALGVENGSIHLYNSKSGSIYHSYNKAHQKSCNSIKFQFNQNQILSCGFDDTIKLWNMDLHLLKTFMASDCLQAFFLNFHPYIVVINQNSIQIIRSLSSQVIIQHSFDAHHLKKFDVGLSGIDDSFIIYRCNNQVRKLNISLQECC